MSSTASLIYSKAREESFQPPPAAKKSRASSQQSSSSRSAARHPIPWPHPLSYLARPTTLAAAGFWFDPAPSSPDRVTCYYCKKSLGGWEPNDDPAREHARRSQDNDCPWATVVCSVELEKLNSSRQAIITDSSRLPTNSQLEKARLSTFGRLWPHDSERGHQATSKRMAKAGWVYTPTPESDDLVSCFYCETFLDGWEPTDNPLHEHKRRSPHCAFFTARVQLPATNNIADGEFEEPVKPKKGKSKAGSSVNGIDLPSSQGQNGKRTTRGGSKKGEDDSGSEATTAGTTRKSGMMNGRRTISGRTNSKQAVEAIVEEGPEPEPLEEGYEEDVVVKPQRGGKKKKPPAPPPAPTPPEVDEVSEVETRSSQQKPPVKAARGKKVAVDDSDAQSSVTTSKPRGRQPSAQAQLGRSTRGRNVPPAPASEAEAEVEPESDIAPPAQAARSSSRAQLGRSTRATTNGKKKTTAAPVPISVSASEAEVEEVEPPAKPARSSSRAPLGRSTRAASGTRKAKDPAASSVPFPMSASEADPEMESDFVPSAPPPPPVKKPASKAGKKKAPAAVPKKPSPPAYDSDPDGGDEVPGTELEDEVELEVEPEPEPQLEPEQTPVPRKRIGRPPKKKATTTKETNGDVNMATEEESAAEVVVQAPKKRGRPSKKPPSSTAAATAAGKKKKVPVAASRPVEGENDVEEIYLSPEHTDADANADADADDTDAHEKRVLSSTLPPAHHRMSSQSQPPPAKPASKKHSSVAPVPTLSAPLPPPAPPPSKGKGREKPVTNGATNGDLSRIVETEDDGDYDNDGGAEMNLLDKFKKAAAVNGKGKGKASSAPPSTVGASSWNGRPMIVAPIPEDEEGDRTLGAEESNAMDVDEVKRESPEPGRPQPQPAATILLNGHTPSPASQRQQAPASSSFGANSGTGSAPVPRPRGVTRKVTIPPIIELTPAEREMTIEQWIRHEIQKQYQQLQAAGERDIADFIAKAAEARKKIEEL